MPADKAQAAAASAATADRNAPAALVEPYAQAAPALPALLADAVRTWPQNQALEFHGKTHRYRDLWQLACRTARGLQDRLGLQKGDRVALMLPNTPYYPILYYGVLLAGGVVVNINPLYAEREIDHLVRDSGVTALATLNLQALYPKVKGRLSDTQLKSLIVCPMADLLPLTQRAFYRLARRRETVPFPDDDQHINVNKLTQNDGRLTATPIAAPGDLAVLQYTGGTTGTPKGAMLTHANLYTNAQQTVEWGSTTTYGGEKMLGVLPLFHAFGMTAVMNVSFMLGAQLILRPRFRTAEVLDVIHRQKPTLMMGVPTMYDSLNQHSEAEKYDLSSLKYCISGGAPLKPAIQAAFEKETGCTLVEGYGLSEASPVVSCNPIGAGNKPGSIGLAYPDTRLRITDPEAPDKDMPIGGPGEIRVAGPQVMAGYWRQPEETAMALLGGYLRTGDLGYLDEQGYLYIVDRLKDLILVGGFNVYPRMVEEAIELHPDILEAVVVGAEDPHHGEMVLAFVRKTGDSDLTTAALRRFLRDKLASFEQPRRITFRDAFPRTLMGKPDRRALRRLVARQGERGRDAAAADDEDETA